MKDQQPTSDASGNVTVPVFVDDVKRLDDFQMARCAYFLIESEDPTPELGVVLQERALPLLLVGMSAVLHRPIDAASFETPDQIEAVFSIVEQNEALRIDSANIWLPNFLLRYGGERQERAQVYRIDLPVFTSACQHWDGRLDEAAFIERCRAGQAACRHSAAETEAFARWTARQIGEARENYALQRERDQVLGWRSTGGATGSA